MKVVSWICWLLTACVCLSEARYKLRRPPSAQPPPQLFKKPWPIAHRISMGNTLHIGGNFGHKRPLYKPANYRIRRPPIYNVLPTTWMNQVPVLGVINNNAVLPQRPPGKEFHLMNKLPEYSPEYRPESAVMPPTRKDGMDDDNGAIHTIPAPNLSLADKPYNLVKGNENPEDQVSRHQYPNDGQYNANIPGTPETNFGFGTLVTSVAPQRTVTSPSPTQNQYEVTETNEIGPKDYHTVQPTFYTTEFDVTRLVTPQNSDPQTNELFLKHSEVRNGLKPGLVGTNIQFGQSNAPMQTSLHSSLHVGFPGTAGQASSSLGHRVPDLHVGHPAPAGPPLSATQLYDLLNSFPSQVNERYTTGQQPQLQQHTLEQKLGQLFQPTGEVISFLQPQMHSFNYDEQANKRQELQQQQQQQQILLGQDYASGRVTADYNLEPETVGNAQSHVNNINGNSVSNEELGYRNSEASDQAENHIEYEVSGNQRGESTYFSDVGNEDSISTRFYTTLPNKDAAEKLAALAAAGNVNSHLIKQIRKQQQQQQLRDQQDMQQSDEPMPENHKDGEYKVNEPQDDDVPYDPQQQQQQYSDQQQEQYDEQQQRYDEKQEQFDQQQYHRQNYRQQQQIRQEQELNDEYEQQRFSHQQQQPQQQQQQQYEGGQLDKGNKRPMRIMVPDVEEYAEENSQRTSSGTENTTEDYDYENPEPDVVNAQSTVLLDSRKTYKQNPNSEFGTRLTAIKAQ